MGFPPPNVPFHFTVYTVEQSIAENESMEEQLYLVLQNMYLLSYRTHNSYYTEHISLILQNIHLLSYKKSISCPTKHVSLILLFHYPRLINGLCKSFNYKFQLVPWGTYNSPPTCMYYIDLEEVLLSSIYNLTLSLPVFFVWLIQQILILLLHFQISLTFFYGI